MFWPVPMTAALLLTLWGAWLGRGAWMVPALALAAYVAVRVVVEMTPASIHEITICAAWLCACAIMVTLPAGKPPAFFFALSALTYPVLLVVGVRIGWMGLSPVLAELFAACALVAIGGGLLSGMGSGAAGDSGRSADRLACAAPGLARGAAQGDCAVRPDRPSLTF